MLSPLTEEEYKSTLGDKMTNVTNTAAQEVDIWPYVQRLVKANIVREEVYTRKLVEYVYRSIEKSFDHILLPTQNSNVFVVVVVDLLHQNIKGHFCPDLNDLYG